MQETPKPHYIVEAPSGDRHQLGFDWENYLGAGGRSPLFCAVLCHAAPSRVTWAGV